MEKVVRKSDKSFEFMDQSHVIHVDEKWFFLRSKSHNVRDFPDQPGYQRPPDQTAFHKSHIQKVMFLVAVGKPQKGPSGEFFEGKVGIYPFITPTAAKRDSKHHRKGDTVLKCYTVDADAYYDMMTRKDGVLDMIKAKLPWMKGKTIIIQHNGASPHHGKTNVRRLAEAGQADGWDIKFQTQPAQSPDTNILDLCLFNSMQKQSDHIRGHAGNSVEELIESVYQQWDEYDWKKIERAYALLFEVYRAILRKDGSNQFNLAHSDITERQSRGENPCDPVVSEEDIDRGYRAIAEWHNVPIENIVEWEPDEINMEDPDPLPPESDTEGDDKVLGEAQKEYSVEQIEEALATGCGSSNILPEIEHQRASQGP